MKKQVVYHGSPERFEIAHPKKQIRERNGEVIFDEISFHTSHFRWIALAYTYSFEKVFPDQDESPYYNMGVDLYGSKKEVEIVGVGSLGESLKRLYGKGGYVLSFDDKDFSHKEGLGNLEVIATQAIHPLKIGRIEDPVEEMIREGVRFHFVDLLQK